MLHEFLTSNRAVLIDRCRVTVGSRSDPKATEAALHGAIYFFRDSRLTKLFGTTAMFAKP